MIIFDIFVVDDETSKLAKVQVKAATGKKNKKGFSAQFIIPLKQINDTSTKGNDMRFIFVSRYGKTWQPFVIMTRKELQDRQILEHIGSITKTDEVKLTLYHIYDKKNADKVEKIECGTQKGFSGKGIPKPDLTAFIDKWDKFFTVRITEGN